MSHACDPVRAFIRRQASCVCGHVPTPKHLLVVAPVVLAALVGGYPSMALSPQAPPRSFTFRYENDFFNATDKYYTQGVQLEYSAPLIGRSPTTKLLFRLPGAEERHSMIVEQNCFTPSSIRRDTIFTGDRPFAAAFFIGQRAMSVDTQRGLKLTSLLTLGVLGPCAICAEEQKGIHQALDNIEPLGWEFQVASDVIVNYAVRMEKRVWRTSFAETRLGAGVELGTYRTNASVNGRLDLGRFLSLFDPQVRSRSIHFNVFLNGQATAVAYDASMQGGLFNGYSPYTLPQEAIERLVLRGGGGVELSWRRLCLTYAKTYITPEFVGGKDHGWGTCTIQVLL